MDGPRLDGAVLDAVPSEQTIAMPGNLSRRSGGGGGGCGRTIDAKRSDDECSAQKTSYQPEIPFFSRLVSRPQSYTAQRTDDEL